MMKTKLSQMGNLCGILAPLLWAAVIIFCGSLRPEYNHLTQYISELGERGSSTEFIIRYAGFVPTGVMHIVFSVFLYVVFKGHRLAALAAILLALNGLGRIGAGIFPCETGCAGPRLLLSQKLHSLSSGIGFFALIGASILWGILLRRYDDLKWLGLYSVISGILGFVFLMLMLSSDEMRKGTGLYERLSTGALSLWVFVFALWLWRYKATDLNRESLGRPGGG